MGCDNGPTKSDKKTADSSDSQTLQFRFDKRVETVYFVLMLSGQYEFLISKHPTIYKFAVTNHFSKFKDHKAVKLAKKLIDRGFSFDYAANWIFQFSDFPEFHRSNEINFPFNDTLKNGGRTINADTLELFRKELINFYSESNCDSFFISQKDFLDEMIFKTENAFSKKDLPKIIENYYGIKKNANFFVILSPLLHGGGYGIDCDNKINSKNELFALIGANGEIEFIPVFDKEFLEQDLVIHEFGHSYESEIVEEFLTQTKQYEQTLYPPIKEKVEKEACVGWTTFMHELIDRAVTVRIVENTYGKEASDKLLDFEKSVGFQYVADIADELKNYERQRDKYPTLKDYFPELIKRLGQIKN